MKLTLEQKAFYEYGRAVESLKRTIYETRETAIQEFKDPYRLLSTYDRKQLIDAMGLASEISAVRRYCYPSGVIKWPWELEQKEEGDKQ